MPREAAAGLLVALRAAGYREAAVVGEVVQREAAEYAPLVELAV